MTDYVPREQFMPFHLRENRFACLVCHRRAGKTVACVNELLTRGLATTKHKGRYGYIAPFLSQAKTIAWDYLKDYGQSVMVDKNESELWVELVNGSKVRIFGADNPDALRGMYFDGIILDEYADMRPSLWSKVILPALTDRNGWAVFIGTPKGHNAFFDVYQRSTTSPDWYSYMLRASESGILTPGQLAMAREEMSEDEYQQEYECSFEAAIQGAYYAKLLHQAQVDGRIGRETRDPLMTIRAHWDIGGTGAKADATAIWISQFIGTEVRILDYYEAVGQPLATHVHWLRSNGYENALCVLPHDGKQNDKVFSVSYESALREAGFEVSVIPNQGTGAAKMRIEAARRMLPSCWFNADKTEAGREALACYHEKIDEQRNVGLGPDHDWASHGSDAFGLMAVDRERQPTKQFSKSLNYPSFNYA